MITLNVREILARKEARQAAAEGEISEIEPPVPETPPSPDPAPATDVANDEKAVLQKELWEEFAHVKRQRGKLSSRIAYLVKEVEETLRTESPTLAEIFLKGEYCSPQLKDHYASINDLVASGAVVYDKIKHLETYGMLPAVVSPPSEEDLAEENAIKHEIRRLDDLIYKTNKKVNATNLNGKKSSRSAEWKEKVALAEARRDDLKQKLKRIQHGKRASAEQL